MDWLGNILFLHQRCDHTKLSYVPIQWMPYISSLKDTATQPFHQKLGSLTSLHNMDIRFGENHVEGNFQHSIKFNCTVQLYGAARLS